MSSSAETGTADAVGTACRLCASPVRHLITDLGATPLANSYLRPDQLNAPELYYPLRLLFCAGCLLVQLDFVADPKRIFGAHYPYFSSYSSTLLQQAKAYAETIAARLSLAPGDRVIEIASNDGYLLRHFLEKGIDVLGVEPSGSVAAEAVSGGVPMLQEFFGAEVAAGLARKGIRAQLVVANNVLAHVPAINDFIEGIRIVLAPGGTASIEFHYLLNLVQHTQFDNIYHEHFQYLSLASAQNALAAHGLTIVDVEELPAQGGSLRIYARHADEATNGVSPRVAELLAREHAAGLEALDGYTAFAKRIAGIKLRLMDFLVTARQSGHSVVAYGAAAKGNTLLNTCGVHADLIDYAVDRSPHKQGLYLPGSHIPIYAPATVAETRPDYLLILPWNLREEVMAQMAHIREWGGRFVVPVPDLQVI